MGKLGSPLRGGRKIFKECFVCLRLPGRMDRTQLANVRLSYRPVQVPAPVADRTVTVEEEIAGSAV